MFKNLLEESAIVVLSMLAISGFLGWLAFKFGIIVGILLKL